MANEYYEPIRRLIKSARPIAGVSLIWLFFASLPIQSSVINPLLNNEALPHDFLTLGSVSSSSSSGNGDGQTMAQQESKNMIDNILSSDYLGDDFKLTESAIANIESSLVGFAQRESGIVELMNGGHPISSWIEQQQQQANLQSSSASTHSRIIEELDFVYSVFWSQMKPLISSIITERPNPLTMIIMGDGQEVADLAFRCRRYNELQSLREFASKSSTLEKLVDVFGVELYNHCLVRKLVMLRINNILPSSMVHQFVDIYLDLPSATSVSAFSLSERRNSNGMDSTVAHQLAHSALNFNLEKAMQSLGPLESVAHLVLDARSMSLGGDNGQEAGGKVSLFRSECRNYIEHLGKIWSDFDELARFLSSSMINLKDYGEKIKFVAPQLVYGSICGQLTAAQ